MVSRRSWFIISTMMAVLLFLFFFSGVMKDTLNDYEVNHYSEESRITRSMLNKEKKDSAEIILVGSKTNSELSRVVSQWCSYTGRTLKQYPKSIKYKLPSSTEPLPELILIDSSGMNYDHCIPQIQSWIDTGINLVFCNLPDTEVIKENAELAQILGISAVYSPEVEILGVELFGGFLIGGDTIYRAMNEKEEKNQDFDLTVPWFQTTNGIKTYMVGLMDREKVENEFMPGILWRSSTKASKVFVMNGDYFSTDAAIGILSGIITECSDYDLYPVVNAQNLVLANFPGFSDENKEELMHVYSRPQSSVNKDIIWPSLESILEKTKDKITCMMSPQYDYTDNVEPQSTDFITHFKIINELRGEAGMSTACMSPTSVTEKLETDSHFFAANGSMYAFSSYYAPEKSIHDTAQLAGSRLAPDMRTITVDFKEREELIAFLDEDVTLQRAVIDGASHTYTEDLRVKGIMTALGYSNILLDVNKVTWPETDEDHFEKLADRFSSYLSTYWSSYSTFAKTTLSESDRRVRQFLVLNYETDRTGNIITLDVDNLEEAAWFLLRTHGERICKISGGNYEAVESDIYLIEVTQRHVEIEVEESTVDSYYYLNK